MIASVMNTNLLETTMNKLLAAIAATLLAVTAIASGAEAGFNVRINAPAGFSEVHKAGCGGGGGASAPIAGLPPNRFAAPSRGCKLPAAPSPSRP